MVGFNKDGHIDLNEARALEGVAMLMQQLQADLHLTKEEASSLFTLRALSTFKSYEPSNQITLSEYETLSLLEKFRGARYGFNLQSDAWFSEKKLDKAKTLATLDGLIDEFVSAKDGKLVLSVLPAGFNELRPQAASKVFDFLKEKGIILPTDQRKLGDLIQGQVYALHSGSSQNVVIIHTEVHDKVAILNANFRSSLALGAQLLFHENAHDSVLGLLSNSTLSAQNICQNPTSHPVFKIKCQKLDSLVVGLAGSDYPKQFLPILQEVNTDKTGAALIRAHQIQADASEVYVNRMAQAFQAHSIPVADLHLGVNHVDMVLAGLRKKNISYMLVVSDALREQIKPIEDEKINRVVQRSLQGSRRSDFGLKN